MLGTHKMYEPITASGWSVTLWLACLIAPWLHLVLCHMQFKLLSDPTSLTIIISPLSPSGKASHLLTVPLHDQHSQHWTTSAKMSTRNSHDVAQNLKADGCSVGIGDTQWVTALSHEFVMETQLNKLHHLVSSWGFNAPDPRLGMSLNRLDQTPWTRIHMLMHQFIHRAWFTARRERCSPGMSHPSGRLHVWRSVLWPLWMSAPNRHRKPSLMPFQNV